VVVLPTPPLPEVITITRVMIYLSHMKLICNRFYSIQNLTLTKLSYVKVMISNVKQIIFLITKN
jgi:hypothetical protein